MANTAIILINYKNPKITLECVESLIRLQSSDYRVWFGCKCIVLKGSEILRDTVIAAGSIVSGKQTVHS